MILLSVSTPVFLVFLEILFWCTTDKILDPHAIRLQGMASSLVVNNFPLKVSFCTRKDIRLMITFSFYERAVFLVCLAHTGLVESFIFSHLCGPPEEMMCTQKFTLNDVTMCSIHSSVLLRHFPVQFWSVARHTAGKGTWCCRIPGKNLLLRQ